MILRPRRAPGPVVARLVPAAVLASGALLAGGPATGSAAGPAGPVADRPVMATAAQPAADPVRVLVDRIDPRVATPRGPVRVEGRLVAGDRPVGDLVVRLHLGPRITSRGELRDRPATVWTSVQQQPLAGRLDRDGSVRFTLVEPVAGLGLPAELGVYPMQVSVTGTVDGVSRLAGRADTFLVYAPAEVAQPTPVGWVLPLTDRPRLGPTGALSDDTLAEAVAPGGRLATLLAAARASGGRGAPPVTLALDPALVEAVQVMATGPYAVARPGGGRTVRPRSADAAGFLAGLRAFAHAGGTIIALPYGDVDLAALTHAGFHTDVERARQKGRNVLRDVLGQDPAGRVAYPPAGRLDQETLERLAADGVGTVVLDAAALPPDASLPYTQSAVSRLPTSHGPVRALVADVELGRLVRAAPSSATTPRLVEQFLDAETAMITAERPGETRPVLLSLPRDWDPPASIASFVLARLQSVPWVRPAPLSGLLRASSYRRGELVYPAELRATELPPHHLAAIDAVRTELVGFRAALAGSPPVSFPSPAPAPNSSPCTGPAASVSAAPAASSSAASAAASSSAATADASLSDDRLTAPLDTALLRAESAAWRGDPAGAEALRGAVAGRLAELQGCVRVVASRVVTLTSRSGKVPVTLENDLPERVTVQLVLSAVDRARLGSTVVVARTLNPRQKVQVEIQVRAESAGTFPVQLALLTPEDQPLSPAPPLRILVRSTAYGIVAVAITGSALGVLALAVLVRLTRRPRALRRPPAATP